MICKNCGNQIRDDAKFCPHCGAVSGAATAPSYAGPEGPVPGGNSKKGPIIGIAVVLVAIIAAAAVFMSGIFSSPKGRLEKAAAKTLAAYAAVSDSMGLPDLDPLVQSRSYSQQFSMELNSINSALVGYDMSALSGLGLRMNAGLDWDNRVMDLDFGAFWGDEDIVSLQMAVEDNRLYLASPEFTSSAFYGVDTETLGADLTELTGDDSVADLSFNIFDWMDLAFPENPQEAMKASIQEANKALWEEVRVEKQGKETIQVNGEDVNAQAFRVVVPKRAVQSYAAALNDILSSVDYEALYEEMLRTFGMSQDEIDEIMDQIGTIDPYAQLGDLLDEAADVLGDVRLTVYVGGGYLSAVHYEERIQGSDVKVALYLGGGDNYADDLSLDLSIDGSQVQITSTGDHTGKGGAVTDKTTVKVGLVQFTSEFSYDPKNGGIDWSVNIPGAGSLSMVGVLTAGKESIDLQMDSITLHVMGLEVFSMGMDYYLGPWKGTISLNSPQMIPDMDMMELFNLATDIQNRAEAWENDMAAMFAQRLPAELFS